MTRNAYIEEISKRIGKRSLIWFGQAGANALPLAHIPQFWGAYSVAAPAGFPDGHEVCLEQLTGERVRPEGRELRPDHSDVHREFARRLYASLSEPAVTVAHQASRFFASVYFLRREYVEHLGLFHERQEVFNHKPWVESGLQGIGIRTLPWQYFATYERPTLMSALEHSLRTGPVVLRANRSVSGRGLTLVRRPEEIPPEFLDASADGFVAMAPFLVPSVPLNVNACVFPDGTVSLHSPSLQLIGIPGVARSAFAYCGNDFARVRELDAAVLETLQRMTMLTGRWLSSMGYVGAFGVDALLHQGTVYLTEVNPRFQGSTLLSAQLDTALDRPDVLLAHVGAFLGLPAPDPWDLQTLAKEQAPAAHIWARNGDEQVVGLGPHWQPPDDVEYWMLPDRGVIVQPHALLCRVVVRHAVTDDGWRLHGDTAAWFADVPRRLFQTANPAGSEEGSTASIKGPAPASKSANLRERGQA